MFQTWSEYREWNARMADERPYEDESLQDDDDTDT